MPDDELAATERWAAARWGTDSPLYRATVCFAAHRCPRCEGPLETSPQEPTLRHCRRCCVAWFAQHHEDDGRPREGSMVFAFRIT